MSQQEQRSAYLSHASMPEGNPYVNISADASSTFVKPLHEGSSHSSSPYTFSPETAFPPPPPYLYQQLPYQPRRNRGHLIAIAVLALIVVGLGSLEVYQFAEGKLLAHDPNRYLRSNQPITSSVQHASASHKATPVLALTPGTIKENILLTCGVCDDPVLTTINTITIDMTNLRVVWVVKLNNQSVAEQVDNFNDFSLQDPNGNIYEGTGKLNNVFILNVWCELS